MTLATTITSRITEVARQIVGAIPTAVEVLSEDHRVIRFRVRRGFGWRLSTIVLAKNSLLKLANDPNRDVKIEYLQRDIVNSADRRAEYRYPRTLFSHA